MAQQKLVQIGQGYEELKNTYWGNQAVTKRYYADGRLLATRSETSLAFVQQGHLGSTSLVTGPAPDSSHSGPLLAHERYSAYGERRGGEEPKTTQYLFTGQHYNSLFGLYYYGGSNGAGRFYDPLLGRFIQPHDVIQGTGSQSLNLYVLYATSVT